MFSLNNIGKVEVEIGHPVLLSVMLLTILPMSTAYIDCRISCRRCHENTEHPSVLEVYCAMCEECKQRRREKIQGRSGTTIGSGSIAIAQVQAQTTLPSPPPPQPAPTPPPPPPPPPAPSPPQPHVPMVGRAAPIRHLSRMMRDGFDDDREHDIPYPPPAPIIMAPAGVAVVYPPGCPTPPPCSESEEEVTIRFREVPTTPTTTTTTTTTTPPSTTACPPFPPCKKKRKHYPMPFMPHMMAPMMMPCMPCMPMCPYPCPSILPPVSVPIMVSRAPSSASTVGYQYVYIGIPRSAMRS